MIIQVERSMTHGKLKFIPKNDLAIVFCALLKQKTLTYQNIVKLKELGYQTIQISKAEEL